VTGGFPGLGFLLFLLFIGFAVFAVGGRHRAGWGAGHGPWAGGTAGGHAGGPGSPLDPSDPRRQWVADLHRRLHEEELGGGRPVDGSPAG
jgi:hypothetical protein